MDSIMSAIRTVDDLADTWRVIDGGHGYSAPQAFVMLIDRRGSMVPSLVHLYDEDVDSGDLLDHLPDLVEMLRQALDDLAPGGSVALMRCRPGSGSMNPSDRRWCRAAHHALQGAPFASRPMFFATDAGPVIVPPDVLIADD